jgi:2-polyprenyl-6-methoxyphenol hydroxylase-like FAD-dependent oxidoreductase
MGARSGAASAWKTSTSRTKDVTIRAGGEVFRGRWLVGCDGGRSTVRKVGGFEFVGTDPEFTGYSVRSRNG